MPPPLMDGGVLHHMGVIQGPKFGEILELLYDAQLEGRVKTEDDVMELVRELSRNHGYTE